MGLSAFGWHTRRPISRFTSIPQEGSIQQLYPIGSNLCGRNVEANEKGCELKLAVQRVMEKRSDWKRAEWIREQMSPRHPCPHREEMGIGRVCNAKAMFEGTDWISTVGRRSRQC